VGEKKNYFTSAKKAWRSIDYVYHFWKEDGGLVLPKDILERKRKGPRTNTFFFFSPSYILYM